MVDVSLDSPLVSVITVVYNAAVTLEQTIQSVIGQRDVRVEYVIIDGGSTDDTLEVVSKYKSNIATCISEPDNGIYDAMNKGVAASHGDWILFLNAGDSFVDNQSLSLLVRAAKNTSVVPDLVFGDALLVNPDATTSRMNMHNTLPFLIRHSICHQSMLYHRHCFERIGLFDTSYRLVADFDHLLRMRWQGAKLQKLDVPVSRYPLDGLSAQKENIALIWRERMTMYRRARYMPFVVRFSFWFYAKLAYEFRRRSK